MYRKIIFAAVLIAFVSFQLASTLQCYDCWNASQCRNPSKINCDQKSANASTKILGSYFRDVSNKTSNNFNCFHWNGTEYNNVVTFKGCVYQQIEPCYLNPWQNHSTLRKTACKKCSNNLCNGNNPAGTFSSSLYTLMASAVLVFIAKAFTI